MKRILRVAALILITAYSAFSSAIHHDMVKEKCRREWNLNRVSGTLIDNKKLDRSIYMLTNYLFIH